MNDAFSAASTMSHAMARFAPAPAATPFTAQITGFSIFRIRSMSGLYVCRTVVPRSSLPSTGRRNVGQILAGAERAPGAGEDDSANRLVCSGTVQNRAKLARHLQVEAVEHLGAVERDFHHAASCLGYYEVIGHFISSAPSRSVAHRIRLRWNYLYRSSRRIDPILT